MGSGPPFDEFAVGRGPGTYAATEAALQLGTIPDPSIAEPLEVMSEAALALCTGDPRTLTVRIAYSGPLLGRAARTLDGKSVYEEKRA